MSEWGQPLDDFLIENKETEKKIEIEKKNNIEFSRNSFTDNPRPTPILKNNFNPRSQILPEFKSNIIYSSKYPTINKKENYNDSHKINNFENKTIINNKNEVDKIFKNSLDKRGKRIDYEPKSNINNDYLDLFKISGVIEFCKPPIWENFYESLNIEMCQYSWGQFGEMIPFQ